MLLVSRAKVCQGYIRCVILSSYQHVGYADSWCVLAENILRGQIMPALYRAVVLMARILTFMQVRQVLCLFIPTSCQVCNQTLCTVQTSYCN